MTRSHWLFLFLLIGLFVGLSCIVLGAELGSRANSNDLPWSHNAIEFIIGVPAAPERVVMRANADTHTLEFIDATGQLSGELQWANGKLTFVGSSNPSAQIFFDDFLKQLVDKYIAEHCGARV